MSKEQDDFTKLYHTVNEVMDVIGAHGQVHSTDDRVIAVMDALYELDGGVYDPKKTFNTQSI